MTSMTSRMRASRSRCAWVYRSAVPPSSMIRREIRRFLEHLFDGSAAPLVAHLAEMDELSLEDLRELEGRLRAEPERGRASRSKRGQR